MELEVGSVYSVGDRGDSAGPRTGSLGTTMEGQHVGEGGGKTVDWAGRAAAQRSGLAVLLKAEMAAPGQGPPALMLRF